MNSHRDRLSILFICLLSGCNGGDSDSVTDSQLSQTAGALNWESAINFCQSLDYADYSDWRLPNIKELHSIVDYSRSPDTSGSAAIDPVFFSTEIVNEEGQTDYPYYWSSTTHLSDSGSTANAAYIAFGRALGYMDGEWKDVHGAGAQRSDPKTGDASDYPEGHGPQGDAIRIENHVRCVRDDSTVSTPSYIIVDTNQTTRTTSTFGEDSDYAGIQPSYSASSSDVTEDNNTGLMWQKDMGSKVSYSDALSSAAASTLGGYTDWRLPTIKELYSLILFSGEDATSCTGSADDCTTEKFIDTTYFDQPYGDTDSGERVIDAQTWSSSEYVSTTMDGDDTVFGVNFVDGRIKGYGTYDGASGSDKLLYARYVRGSADYQSSTFVDNSDGTITDNATGLTWLQYDSGYLTSDD
ncbi:DUF1566 domain-containing protein [Vibrio brasiliensis]|jgi:hypothetical protein|uniref:Lcl C-terminal domain-containing protein n=1 Tax=Vibrio brasiliensis TaxID=170652 RepID=UPI001EFCBC9C|nr:DUF1566 domain-containing protein [Vibrio brasiliensis]MCG9749369.1 DUF1566 domain-containing protein [Vibrio brasiliensis]